MINKEITIVSRKSMAWDSRWFTDYAFGIGKQEPWRHHAIKKNPLRPCQSHFLSGRSDLYLHEVNSHYCFYILLISPPIQAFSGTLVRPFKHRKQERSVVARKTTWLVVSLGEASASPGAADAAGNSITHTDEQESGACLVLTWEDLPVPPWSVRHWPCGDKRGRWEHPLYRQAACDCHVI